MIPFVFCNFMSSDRRGLAASKLRGAAAVCVTLLRFAAESRKSHCNGSVRVANAALAAKLFDFGIIHFPL